MLLVFFSIVFFLFKASTLFCVLYFKFQLDKDAVEVK